MKNRNLFVVVASYFLNGLETSIVNVIWQPFILSFGVPVSVLGLLTSIGGWNGIIPTIISPIGGWFADRRGRKWLMLGGSLALMASYVLYALAGWAGWVFLVVPGIFLAGLAAVSRPIASALTGESVRAGRQASAFSLVMFANILPGILAPLVAGYLADRAGYAPGFVVALGAECVAFVLIARYLQETFQNSAERIDWRGLAQVLRRAWRPPAGMGGFFVMCAMDSFSWGLGWALLYGLISKEYHFDTIQLGIMASVMSASWAVFQLPIGRIIDKSGIKWIMAISESSGAPLMLIWMTQTRFEIFVASMVLFAVNAALWIPARNTYIARAAPAENRAEVFGLLTAFTGLIGFPAPFIGGFLYDHWGYAVPFIANLIGSVLTFCVILLFVREPHAAHSS
ncbi:MAG: MFS transporter [Anaerolineae bacterium]